MLLIIGLVLLVVWLGGFLILKKTVGWLFHVLLVLAVVVIAIHFLSGKATP
ncbi:MAG: lmo0937 family membrane protein [Gemmatimonadaceae bacterium]